MNDILMGVLSPYGHCILVVGDFYCKTSVVTMNPSPATATQSTSDATWQVGELCRYSSQPVSVNISDLKLLRFNKVKMCSESVLSRLTRRLR